MRSAPAGAATATNVSREMISAKIANIAIAPRNDQQQQRPASGHERHQRQDDRIEELVFIAPPSRSCRRSPPRRPPRPIRHRSASCRTACAAAASDTCCAPVGAVVHGRVNHALIHAVPENARRAVDQRLHEQRRVDFVDVVLVHDRLVEAAERCPRSSAEVRGRL